MRLRARARPTITAATHPQRHSQRTTWEGYRQARPCTGYMQLVSGNGTSGTSSLVLPHVLTSSAWARIHMLNRVPFSRFVRSPTCTFPTTRSRIAHPTCPATPASADVSNVQALIGQHFATPEDHVPLERIRLRATLPAGPERKLIKQLGTGRPSTRNVFNSTVVLALSIAAAATFLLNPTRYISISRIRLAVRRHVPETARARPC